MSRLVLAGSRGGCASMRPMVQTRWHKRNVFISSHFAHIRAVAHMRQAGTTNTCTHRGANDLIEETLAAFLPVNPCAASVKSAGSW